jgi:hypothetical protein
VNVSFVPVADIPFYLRSTGPVTFSGTTTRPAERGHLKCSDAAGNSRLSGALSGPNSPSLGLRICVPGRD